MWSVDLKLGYATWLSVGISNYSSPNLLTHQWNSSHSSRILWVAVYGYGKPRQKNGKVVTLPREKIDFGKSGLLLSAEITFCRDGALLWKTSHLSLTLHLISLPLENFPIEASVVRSITYERLLFEVLSSGCRRTQCLLKNRIMKTATTGRRNSPEKLIPVSRSHISSFDES